MKILSRFVVIIFCALAAGPILWHLASSLKNAAEVTQIPPAFFPSRPTLENYFELFVRRPFLTYCLNSFIIAACFLVWLSFRRSCLFSRFTNLCGYWG
jgi:multiple sugar transport system permease protein